MLALYSAVLPPSLIVFCLTKDGSKVISRENMSWTRQVCVPLSVVPWLCHIICDICDISDSRKPTAALKIPLWRGLWHYNCWQKKRQGSLFRCISCLILREGSLSEKKRDCVRKIPKFPPQFGKPLLKKKVGFIFHFRTSGTFLVTKNHNFE